MPVHRAWNLAPLKQAPLTSSAPFDTSQDFAVVVGVSDDAALPDLRAADAARQ